MCVQLSAQQRNSNHPRNAPFISELEGPRAAIEDALPQPGIRGERYMINPILLIEYIR